VCFSGGGVNVRFAGGGGGGEGASFGCGRAGRTFRVSPFLQMARRRFLLQKRVLPATMDKYRVGVKDFLDWARGEGESARTVPELDNLLADYIHHVYELHDGKCRHKASNALFGLKQLLPELDSRALPISAACCKGWEKDKPSVPYPPLTWELTVVIAYSMALRGHLRMAVATLLGFDCFLRISELLGLVREDFADGSDLRTGAEYRKAGLRLGKTKTGKNQWVEPESAAVLTCLRRLVAKTGAQERIFPFTAARYRREFRSVCDELGLEARYVPHSLRHGGATRALLLGMPISEIMSRGRWQSLKSAQRYMQAGRAILLTLGLPKRVVEFGARLSGQLVSMLFPTKPEDVVLFTQLHCRVAPAPVPWRDLELGEGAAGRR
jgi:integrase